MPHVGGTNAFPFEKWEVVIVFFTCLSATTLANAQDLWLQSIWSHQLHASLNSLIYSIYALLWTKYIHAHHTLKKEQTREVQWFNTVVFCPVLSIANVVQIPGSCQDSSKPSFSDTAQFVCIVICHPHFNYSVWFQLEGKNKNNFKKINMKDNPNYCWQEKKPVTDFKTWRGAFCFKKESTGN